MNDLNKFLFIASFFVSVLFLPWWVSVFIAVILLAEWRAYVSVILGAVMLDVIFGSPLTLLGGFAYLYTGIFVALVALGIWLAVYSTRFAYLYTGIFVAVVALVCFLNRAMLE